MKAARLLTAKERYPEWHGRQGLDLSGKPLAQACALPGLAVAHLKHRHQLAKRVAGIARRQHIKMASCLA